MRDLPLFSVMIPTRHRNDDLVTCLDQLQPGAQSLSFNKYEVVVTDDGRESSAESAIANRHPWAKWMQGPCRGPAANRNHGALHSSGRWIFFTDDDCLSHEGWLEAFLTAANDAEEVLEGRTICSAGLPSPVMEAPVNEKGGCLWACNFAIRRELFFDCGAFDERFPRASREDGELRMRLERRGARFRFVPDALVDHPPRRIPFGFNNGYRWQSKALKERLTGEKPGVNAILGLRISKRLPGKLRRTRGLKEGLWLTSCVLLEALQTMACARRWQAWARQQCERGRPEVHDILARTQQ